MDSIRHRASRGSGRSALLLSSVLALLALACLPVAAHADSSGVEYETGLPKPEGSGQSHKEQVAKSSDSSKNGGAEAPSNAGSGSDESSYTEESQSSEGGGAATAGNDGGSGQGNPGGGASTPEKAGLQPATPIAKSEAAPEDGGGSSPLVPILIGILVLAAISIAAVMIRQRRQRDGSGPPSLSTKAG